LRHTFIHSTLRFVEFLIVGVEFGCFFLGGLGWGGWWGCAYCFAVWKMCELGDEEVDLFEGYDGSL
jgi:hypothetical protein